MDGFLIAFINGLISALVIYYIVHTVVSKALAKHAEDTRAIIQDAIVKALQESRNKTIQEGAREQRVNLRGPFKTPSPINLKAGVGQLPSDGPEQSDQ